jgi:hypothetical protein
MGTNAQLGNWSVESDTAWILSVPAIVAEPMLKRKVGTERETSHG